MQGGAAAPAPERPAAPRGACRACRSQAVAEQSAFLRFTPRAPLAPSAAARYGAGRLSRRRRMATYAMARVSGSLMAACAAAAARWLHRATPRLRQARRRSAGEVPSKAAAAGRAMRPSSSRNSSSVSSSRASPGLTGPGGFSARLAVGAADRAGGGGHRGGGGGCGGKFQAALLLGARPRFLPFGSCTSIEPAVAELVCPELLAKAAVLVR